MTKRLIYTDLDSLFDTKIVFLGMIDNRLVREYATREYNIDNGILYLTDETFRTLFKGRDRRVFEQAVNSYGADIIRNIIRDTVSNNDIGRGVSVICSVMINTYPYKLTDEEMSELTIFYKQYFPFAEDVAVIYKERLSKAMVNKISVAVLRNGFDWFIDMKTVDVGFRCPHLRLILPNTVSNLSYFNSNKIDVDTLRNNLVSLFASDIIVDFVDEELFMVRVDNTLD